MLQISNRLNAGTQPVRRARFISSYSSKHEANLVEHSLNYILWIQDLIDGTSSSRKETYEPERVVTGLDVYVVARLIVDLVRDFWLDQRQPAHKVILDADMMLEGPGRAAYIRYWDVRRGENGDL